MEIKAKINKPYTDKEYANFVYKYNHELGYLIEETETELQALGKTVKEIEAEKQAQFDKEFFKTSLGYVRRNVSMKTGETKDFLADILPVLEVGVPIIFYDRDLNQSKKMVTEVFLAECKEQILKDFWGE
jgi:hypothetical protein